jgi:hypothetical protein
MGPARRRSRSPRAVPFQEGRRSPSVEVRGRHRDPGAGPQPGRHEGRDREHRQPQRGRRIHLARYAPVALCEALGIPSHVAVLTPEERSVTDAPELPRYDVSWVADPVRREAMREPAR